MFPGSVGAEVRAGDAPSPAAQCAQMLSLLRVESVVSVQARARGAGRAAVRACRAFREQVGADVSEGMPPSSTPSYVRGLARQLLQLLFVLLLAMKIDGVDMSWCTPR